MMMNDFLYATKILRCLTAKYAGLEQPGKNENEWEPATDALPFYVCPMFKNIGHIPLPLVIGAAESHCGPLQRAALDFAEWMAFYTPFARGYNSAFVDCAEYDNQYPVNQ